MATCTNCGAELLPEWKFCILCGARAPKVVGETPENEASPEITETVQRRLRRRRLSLPLLVAILLGFATVSFVIYRMVVLSSDVAP